MTGEELRRMRKAKRMTQGDLATAIGYSRKTIISWENAVHPIPDAAASKITDACIGPPPMDSHTAKRVADTLKGYTAMRQDFSHADILDLWAKAGYQLCHEEKLAIAAAFPDILNNGH